MSKRDDGDVAFPVPGTEYNERYPGMSLRDYFAAKAMAALVKDACENDGREPIDIAAEAYELANAMLKARNQ